MGVSFVMINQPFWQGPGIRLADKLTLQSSVTNVVPSSMTLALHISRDALTRSKIRQGLDGAIQPGRRLKFDLKKLEKQPLLLSMYAETLRFGVQIHIPRTAPHRNLSIGSMLIPQDKLILINTWLAHTDESVWNTKGNTFPLGKFWAQRFLTDPKDPFSGPTKKRFQTHERTNTEVENVEGPHFSTEGLEGAWIPYGGWSLFFEKYYSSNLS